MPKPILGIAALLCFSLTGGASAAASIQTSSNFPRHLQGGDGDGASVTRETVSLADISTAPDEIRELSEAFSDVVPRRVVLSHAQALSTMQAAMDVMSNAGVEITKPQLLLAVDRDPSVQEMSVILARPLPEQWTLLGTTHVSTGKPGRKEHFKTPVGVFLNDGRILGYRAEGTYNENHIRGLGLKGMRVWDFGWQKTENWKRPGTTSVIRLEMHATDPSVLEQRIGRPDSEGCVRIPAAMNEFLDHYGVLDGLIEQRATTDRRFMALLNADRDPSSYAGDKLIVFDSRSQHRR